MSTLWTVQDVAKYLGVPVKTIYEWRRNEYGPPGKRLGKHLRFKPEDVVDWFESLDSKID